MTASRRFFYRVLGTLLVPSVSAVLGFGAIVEWMVRRQIVSDIEQSIEEKAALLGPGVSVSGATALTGVEDLLGRMALSSGLRITWIRGDGTVLADSEEDAQRMDNHGDRPEVLEALAHGKGRSSRFSATLGEEMIYFARSIGEGEGDIGTVRLAVPARRISERLRPFRVAFGAALAALLSVSLLTAGWLARDVASAAREIAQAAGKMADGQHGGKARVYRSDTLGVLARSVNRMGELLGKRLDEAVEEREKLAAMLAGLSDGVIGLDSVGRVILCNEAARNLLGIHENPLGRPIEEAFRVAPLMEMVSRASGVIEPEASSFSLFLDGRERHLRATARPFGSADRFGLVLVIRDETQARSLERTRRDFAANASHELKTPLTALKGYVDSLLDGAAEDPLTCKRFLKQMAWNIKRLTDLTDDLLDLSRLEARDGEPEAERLDAVALFTDVVSGYVRPAQEKKIRLSVSFPEKPVWVLGALESAARILANLLDNAIKYTDEGGSVSVRLEARSGQALLEVADTGIGIPIAEQQRIFERFYRVDRARSVATGGTGLGLSIVKHAVEQMGGSVDVESAPGAGSTFSVHLPENTGTRKYGDTILINS